MTTGRRKEARYRVIDDVFAVTKSNPGILGNILDISNQGLSFHCLANGEFSEDIFEIDLFFSKSGYVTKRIQCRKVFERTEHSQMPFSSLMMRRIGVNFIKLNTHQHRQLDHFISHLTRGEVSDRRCGMDRRSFKAGAGTSSGAKQGNSSRSEINNNRERRYNSDRRFK